MADINDLEYPMSDFKKILVSEEEITGIICRIADEINKNYAGKKLLICSILKGAFIFTSDLIRQLKIPLEVAFIKASSYGGGAVSTGTGGVKVIEFSGLENYTGFDILVVDDILDTGNTLFYLKEFLMGKGFKNIEFCTLLDKPERRESEIYVKYIGKQIENEFVVGYGLDFNEKYRNLPFIASLNEKIYQ